MQTNIETAAEAVLSFLTEIPLSASTVKFYKSCYRAISGYCRCKGIDSFSDDDAEDFRKFQMNRHENGEIGWVYALTLRKAAVMLSDYMSGKELVWERRNYNPKSFCANYERTLVDFENSIASSLSRGSVRNVMIMTRQFLEYLENVGVQDFNKLTLDETRRFIINASPKHQGNMLNLTWPIKKFVAFLKDAGHISFGTERLFFLLQNG